MSVFRSVLAAGALSLVATISTAQDKALSLVCEGARIEPAGSASSPIKLELKIGPGKAFSLSGAGVAPGSRFVTNNEIQFRFANKDFTGEYFHYTGDLFLIYKSRQLAKLTCKRV